MKIINFKPKKILILITLEKIINIKILRNIKNFKYIIFYIKNKIFQISITIILFYYKIYNVVIIFNKFLF